MTAQPLQGGILMNTTTAETAGFDLTTAEAPVLDGLNEAMERWFRENASSINDMAMMLFDHPEEPDEEFYSSGLHRAFLQEQGFTIEELDDMPTAFIASWKQGTGSPGLGFLAEYDALSGMAQKPVSRPAPIEGQSCGHGCGHNLLGTACTAAACALKAHMEATGEDGAVYLYGCPAEETMSGKIIMDQKGLFHRLDAAITWHPFTRNRISYDHWLAQDVKHYRFYGKAAHAAVCPENGRSALDAAELMDVGVNYLREHVANDVRIHYNYVHADEPANIVPDFVELGYFIRSGLRSRTDDASERVDNCARGAALMTGTRVEIDLLKSCREFKVNDVLSTVFHDAMAQIALPSYTEEEIRFAREITENASLDNVLLRRAKKRGDNLNDPSLFFGPLLPLEDEPNILSIGTDATEVSHRVPTIMLSAAAFCRGTALHSWPASAQAGTSIGRRAMMYAAEGMAEGARRLMKDPSLLREAWKEHRQTE